MVSRRQMIRGSVALGGVSMAGLSGCLGFGGSGGTTLEGWLVDPGRLPTDDNSYLIRALDLSAFAAQSDSFPREEWTEYRDDQLSSFEFTRLFAEDVDLLVTAGGGWLASGYNVVSGSIDPETVSSDLESSEYSLAREYEGFELYEREESQTAVALGSDVLIPVSAFEDDPLRSAELVIDTRDGDSRQYGAIVSEVGTVLSSASIGDWFFGQVTPGEPTEETNVEQGQFRDELGFGASMSIGSDTTEFEYVILFLDESAVVRQDIEDWTREADAFDRWREIDVDTSGNMATVTGQFPTAEIFEQIS